MLVKFPDDATLVAEVSHLLTVAEAAIESQRKEFGENVRDPLARPIFLRSSLSK